MSFELKIFYSWQSDADRKINKNVIHDALSIAIEALNAEIEFAEVERANQSLQLDQDTKGVLGSPPIFETILKKIRAADVVVFDVSLVAEGRDKKKHINSNVAIELGFALGAKGTEPLLKVMNTHFGGTSQLPFDLRDRRQPRQYCLHPNASKTEIAAARNKLAAEFLAILREYLNNAENASDSSNAAYEPQASTHVDTAFWPKTAVLAKSYHEEKPLYCDSSHLVSLRFIPKLEQDKMTAADCLHKVKDYPPLLNVGSYSTSINRWGAISHTKAFDFDTVLSGLQLFKTREIWMFSSDFINQHKLDDADNALWFIHHYSLMKYLPDAIRNGIQLAEEIIDGAIELRLTAADLSEVFVKSGETYRPKNNEIFENSVEISSIVDSGLDQKKIAFEFTKKIYAEAGVKLDPQIRGNRIA